MPKPTQHTSTAQLSVAPSNLVTRKIRRVAPGKGSLGLPSERVRGRGAGTRKDLPPSKSLVDS